MKNSKLTSSMLIKDTLACNYGTGGKYLDSWYAIVTGSL